MDSLDSMGCQWYNFGFFFNVFIVSMVLFIVVFKISCVCNVPSFIRSNLLQEVVLTKKNMCTTNIFGMCKCLCEDFQHFNVCACFVKCVFFGISSLSEFRHLCTTDVKRVSRKTLT